MSDTNQEAQVLSRLSTEPSANWIFAIALVLTVLGLTLMFAGLPNGSEATIAAGAGLSSTGGILFALGVFVRQNEIQRSRFYLDEARKGLAAAKGMLADGNNDMRAWILAARTLARTRSLASAITVSEHQTVYDLDADLSRPFFHDVLLADVQGRGSFFMGAKDKAETLEQAHERQRQDYVLRLIPEAAIREVLSFARYPRPYLDPIGDRLDADDLEDIWFLFPSLHAYVGYTRANKVMAATRVAQMEDYEAKLWF